MELFKLENDMPVLNKELRMLEPFRALIVRDRGSKGDNDGRGKAFAMKELAFIHFKYHPNSEYKSLYSSREIDEKIKAHLGLPESWKEDEVVAKAGEFYKQLNYTITVKTLDTAHNALFLLNTLMSKYINNLQGLMEQEVHVATEEERKAEDERIALLVKGAKQFIELTNSLPKSIDTVEGLKTKYEKELDSKKYNTSQKVDDEERPDFLGV